MERRWYRLLLAHKLVSFAILTLTIISGFAGNLFISRTFSARADTPPTVTIDSVQGNFYTNPNDSGSIDTSALTTPVFTQTFPTINFNPPASAQATCASSTGVDENTRPFTDVVQFSDNSCGPIVAQGNGSQAGVGSLAAFQAVFTANLAVSGGPGALQVTFNFFSDDGWVLGAGSRSGGTEQPTYISGSWSNPPATTPKKGYQVVGSYNQPSSPSQNTVTVNFPKAGTYPIEVDYTECCGGELALTLGTTAQNPIPPTTLPPPNGSSLSPSSTTGGGFPNMHLTTCSCAQPVNTATGEFWHHFDDLTVPGRGIALDFNRTYSASLAAQGGPLGYGWTDDYQMALTTDAATGNITVHAGNGSMVMFTANGSRYQPPSYVLASLVKNGDGTFTYKGNDQRSFVFSATGQLLKEVDRNGYVTTLAYTGAGLSTVTDPASRTLTFTYGSNGRIATMTDPASRKVSFIYDASGNLIAARDVSGGVWRFTYDANHLMLTMIDPRKGVLTNVYDSSSRVTSQTDPLGRRTIFAYVTGTSGAETTTMTDAKGNQTRYQYQNLELTAATKGYGTPQAATTTYTYDAATLGVTSVTDPNGHTTTMTYDAKGNLLTVTNALGHKTTNTYDNLNDLLTTTDPLGVTTTMTYDAKGNLLSRSRPLSGTSQSQVAMYKYTDTHHPGDLTAVVDPNGKTWRLAYDSYGNLIRSTDPLGNTTTFRYNVLGWLTATVSPNGNVHGADHDKYQTTIDHNLFGQVTEVTDPLGSETHRHYDDNGNLVMLRDADGNVTRYTYDAANELKATIQPNGTKVATDYNPDGTVFHQYDGKHHATTYRYDALARVTSVTDPLGRTTTVTYDGVGNLHTFTDPQGQVTTYSYDPANELISITYSDNATPNVSHLTYDADGQRLTMTDGSGTSTYHYDSLNRLTSSTDGAGNTVAYGYDLNGQLTMLTYPGGHVVTRKFDPAVRLTTVTDWLGHMTRFGYDPSSNLTTEAFPASTRITDTFRYDAANRLMGIVDARAGDPFATFTYRRDRNGQLISEGDKGVPAGHDTYAYTALNQLSGVNTKTYAYDAADNLTKLLNGSNLVYDAANELTALTNGTTTTTTTFSYDPRGNRTAISKTGSATTSLKYDQANRLTTYGTSATYTYDGDGLRTSKKVGTSTSPFAWDRAEGLPLLLTDGGNSYIYGPAGLPLEQIIGNTAYWYHHDQIGSTRVLTDATGKVLSTYTYNPYGTVTGKIGTIDTAFKYAGEYQDRESGMYYLRARYYDPATAQFISRDPLVATTRSPYGYVSGNPLNASDPTGENPFSLLGAAIGAGVGFVTSTASYTVTSVAQGDFSVRGLAGAAVGGTVGGAISGGCISLTFGLAAAGCGAAGGAAGQFVNNAISGAPLSHDLLTSTVVGAFGGYLGTKIFPTRGFLPKKLSNVIPPWSPNTLRWIKNLFTTSGVVGVAIGFYDLEHSPLGDLYTQALAAGCSS